MAPEYSQSPRLRIACKILSCEFNQNSDMKTGTLMGARLLCGFRITKDRVEHVPFLAES